MLSVKSIKLARVLPSPWSKGSWKVLECNIVDVHSENEVLKNLRLLKLLKCDFADIYNKEYLDRIAYWIIQCLETYKKEGILLEAVQVLNGVMAVIEIS